MKAWFRKFWRDRTGSFAIQFALMIAPLVACTGLAIDGGRIFLARYELASALDAAALAVGSTEAEQAALEELAADYVARNFQMKTVAPVVLTLTQTNDETFVLHGTVDIDTYFMPLFGQPTATVAAESEIRRGGSDVEVALILDTTGSMSGQRIIDLKAAATDLVDIVVAEDQAPFFSKLALIPYSNSVYVGGMTKDGGGNDDNAMTVTARGSIPAAKAISSAGWRTGALQTISAAGWRDGNRMTISAATWKNGNAQNISGITKAAQAVISTTNNHGFSNGDFVYVSGVNGMTQINGKIFVVSDKANKTFKIKSVPTGNYIDTSSGYSTYTSGGTAQKVFNGVADVRVTTDNSNSFATGDRVYISGVGGMTQINNTEIFPSWPVTNLSSTTFLLQGSNGPATSNYTTGTDYASECFLASCDIRVTTSASHGFANGDWVNIYGVSGLTEINNTTSRKSWTIANASGTTYTLAGIFGPTFAPSNAFSGSNGRTGECVVDTCEVQITSTAHGFANSTYVRIANIGGLAGLNDQNWQVANSAANTYRLSGTLPSSVTGTYTENTGNGWCTAYGCEFQRYTSAGGTVRTFRVSNCLTERTGAESDSDAPPSDGLVGLMYPTGGGDSSCATANDVIPMTASRQVLFDAIDDLTVGGSTSGHIGLAWGWYALSPNWASLWPANENRALGYDTENLAKVAVLMTDGAFNTGYCNGVISNDSGFSNNDWQINCNATNGAPFDQAAALCEEMRTQEITIYTVGFGFSEGSTEDQFMTACATMPANAYLANDGEELEAAFRSIATSISLLRLSR